MKAVLLCGGLGTRLKPFTEVIPKPLLPIGESSVLEIQILSLKKHGIKEIFIASSYKAEFIEAFLGDGSKYGLKINFSREVKPLGTCGPVLLLRDKLKEPFFLMNGDILTTLNFTKVYGFALKSEADLTVVTKDIITPFHFGKVTSKGGYIVKIEEKPDFKLEILSGIYILKPNIFDFIPAGCYYGIDSLIKDMLLMKKRVAKYQMNEYWLDIGQIEDYKVAQDAYKQHFNSLKDEKKE